ncbi:hypothetical protein [Kitasatospora sp. NPDC097643]
MEAARGLAIGQLRERQGPFAADPDLWALPQPGSLPTLPPTALSTPTARA